MIPKAKEMSKQTAVEWVIEQIQQKLYIRDEVIEQALKMEKEQIMEAHGDEKDYLTDSGNFITISAEQYYNETYKKEEK
jgi:hypothetical protein